MYSDNWNLREWASNFGVNVELECSLLIWLHFSSLTGFFELKHHILSVLVLAVRYIDFVTYLSTFIVGLAV